MKPTAKEIAIYAQAKFSSVCSDAFEMAFFGFEFDDAFYFAKVNSDRKIEYVSDPFATFVEAIDGIKHYGQLIGVGSQLAQNSAMVIWVTPDL